jgi:hypothetical protein
MFGNIKPALDLLKRLGPTDFSAGAPEYVVKPGATIKVPVSSIAAASAYNASTNNYLTGGNTDWGLAHLGALPPGLRHHGRERRPGR